MSNEIVLNDKTMNKLREINQNLDQLEHMRSVMLETYLDALGETEGKWSASPDGKFLTKQEEPEQKEVEDGSD